MNTRNRARRQRGIASLIVVAVLFFVLSLVAAYTNRSMIFEQRTSANQYRSTQAFEAAEAGVEWALSLLNSGRITGACVPSANVADTSFRDRYLNIGPVPPGAAPALPDGVIDPVLAAPGDPPSSVWPTCVFNGAGWDCNCPVPPAAAALAAPAGSGVFPAFRVRFVRFGPPLPPAAPPSQPSLVRIEVNGCTRLDNACLDFPSQAVAGEGRATLSVLLALRGGLAAPPIAALTVRQGLDAGGAALGAFNANVDAGGISILAGGVLANDGALRLGGAPGSPGALSVRAGDLGLAGLADGDRLFTNTYSTWPAVYLDQPGAVRLACAGTCNAGDVRAMASMNPGRVLWIPGDVDLDAGGDVGSVAEPVLIVATGNVTVDVDFYGLVYSRAATWAAGGAGTIRGAAIAENAFGGNASFSVVYDRDVLARLRWRSGSFVRVPGGWRDY